MALGYLALSTGRVLELLRRADAGGVVLEGHEHTLPTDLARGGADRHGEAGGRGIVVIVLSDHHL